MTSELDYARKPLGIYVAMVGALLLYTIVDPLRYRAVVTWGSAADRARGAAAAHRRRAPRPVRDPVRAQPRPRRLPVRAGDHVARPAAGPLRLVFEGDVDARAEGRHLALVDGDVEARDLRDAQVAEALGGGAHRVLDGVLPGHLARSDQVGHAIDAVAGHGW